MVPVCNIHTEEYMVHIVCLGSSDQCYIYEVYLYLGSSCYYRMVQTLKTTFLKKCLTWQNAKEYVKLYIQKEGNGAQQFQGYGWGVCIRWHRGRWEGRDLGHRQGTPSQ